MLITVFGRRGSGKTTLIRRLIPTQKKPIIVIDVLGNFTNDPWVITYSCEEALNEVLAYVREPSNHLGIIVVVDSNLDRSVDYMCSALWKIDGGTLVLDEVDAISLAESPCFDEAVRYGRNHGIDIVTGCRRPAEISKNITAGADIAFCFNTHEPRDIMYYSEFLGDDLAEKLPKLPQHHGVYKDFQAQKEGIYKTRPDGRIVLLKEKMPEKVQLDLPIKQKEPSKKYKDEHEVLNSVDN